MVFFSQTVKLLSESLFADLQSAAAVAGVMFMDTSATTGTCTFPGNFVDIYYFGNTTVSTTLSLGC
jgi:hypothetical protein